MRCSKHSFNNPVPICKWCRAAARSSLHTGLYPGVSRKTLKIARLEARERGVATLQVLREWRAI